MEPPVYAGPRSFCVTDSSYDGRRNEESLMDSWAAFAIGVSGLLLIESSCSDSDE